MALYLVPGTVLENGTISGGEKKERHKNHDTHKHLGNEEMKKSLMRRRRKEEEGKRNITRY